MYHNRVISRLYIHNFRCLENFELPIQGRSSALLIGKNGAGKTTVGFALEILQKIARGTNRVGELVKPKDLTRERTDLPMRLEIEVELEGKSYGYSIAFDFPESFKELRVFEEKLTVSGKIVYSRELAKVHLTKSGQEREATFFIDWHLVALPIIQQQATKDPVLFFKQWLSRMLILRPMPSLILGHSQEQTLQPDTKVTDIGAWFGGLMSHAPSAYGRVYDYLKQFMPDLEDITNPSVGTDSRSLSIQYSNEKGNLKLPFEDLSDGEKCFIISALVLAANKAYGPLLCFWDEPDNYLAPSEVGHFVVALRKAFQSGGQFIATSHNTETIRRFSDENTLILYRNSHLEPTIVRSLDKVTHSGDVISSLVRGDLEL
jgi:ABC-type Mn2+/Zn2+ transport system ATPase subunit